jgi:hypothetical protein
MTGSEEKAMDKQTLKAVHDDDLEAVLRGLGIYGDFVRGKLRCAFCGDVITMENLHSLFPDSGAVKCTCSRPACVDALLSRIEGREGR